MAQMASVFAELERAMIRERVKRGRKERISGHAPFGWDFGPRGRLVEYAKEQRAVTWIMKLHRRGASLRGIAKQLNDRGVEPKRASWWIHSSVLRIVKRSTKRLPRQLRANLPTPSHLRSSLADPRLVWQVPFPTASDVRHPSPTPEPRRTSNGRCRFLAS
ncbi:MAG TPA: recombinase family protein, partial [Polyangiaceae bacterium]|nr:recombinase family protein [Polyangiaceae bacterium]